jgi:hypothetical protein
MPEAEWNSATSYAVDDVVSYWIDSVYRLYKATQASLNVVPTDATKWQDLGPANLWALFDKSIGTATSAGSGVYEFYYEIQGKGVIDTLTLLNFKGLEFKVEVYDTVTSTWVYDKTFNMVDNSGVNNWFAYFFQEVVYRDRLTVLDLPTFVNPRVKVTVRGNVSAPPSLGVLYFGKRYYVGRSQYGSSLGFTDFSLKTRDDFGGFTVVQRDYSDTLNLTVMVDKSKVDALKNKLLKYRAQPVVVLGTDCYDSTTVYGFHNDTSIVLQHHNESQLSIQFEGVT